MVLATNLGFPRVGLKRELKAALEACWSGKQTQEQLQGTARELRARHWKLQKDAGLAHIPSNDFSFYDHVLDTILMTGAVPAAYGKNIDLHTYFAMARGHQTAGCGHAHAHKSDKPSDVPALEMTKWFDTNYHYIVPVFEADQTFRLASTKPVDEFLEAKKLGIVTRPVLLGPVTFLSVGKRRDHGSTLELLPKLLPVYVELLEKLAAAGAEWVQIDEPALILDQSHAAHESYRQAYAALTRAKARPKILLATYFGTLKPNATVAYNLPVDALHIDLVRAPEQLDGAIAALPAKGILSLGLIDGRNIWRTDLDKALKLAKHAVEALGPDRVWIGPSCSLLHSPIDLAAETKLDDELKSWLAFATQKLGEIATLTQAVSGDKTADKALEASRKAITARSKSPRIHNPAVQKRVKAITPEQAKRKSAYERRKDKQAQRLDLPGLPTTTIGSFPQTAEVRAARADWRNGRKSTADYDRFLEEQTREAIRWQEEVGLDVLVHGEFERNDMVEYFGEQLEGFVFTSGGWVQSYGSRCVKPPIIFGDVSRKGPMTVRWSKFAQSLTAQPVKGMLTGPVTILQWSFVRDDQPRSETCRQIALAIRDEVVDLESAGIAVIQIDEPAIREGLPLLQKDREAYLNWAVECFRLSASGVRDDTQIHTHMCYSEFNDIIASIAAMDADVISIETARSQMELLDAFVNFKYPNEIGPGVYDIHSPRVPSEKEMADLMRLAAKLLPVGHLWVNPDCGLKTRGWPETKTALINMVAATRHLRDEFKLAQGKAKLKAAKAA